MVEVGEMMALVESEDETAWRAALFSLGRKMGFDQLLYGAVPSKHAKFEGAFVQSNYSPEWRREYDAQKLAYIDPTVAHCMRSALPVVWRPETFRTPAQQAMYDEARRFGIRSGVTLPVHGPNGEFGVLSFASDAAPNAEFDRFVEHAMPSMTALRDFAFDSGQRFALTDHGQEQPPRLTKRELEVLTWVMRGKSSWEISRITRCSEATVNFHIGNIRQKFNVNTRQQA
jgi:LuxR family quorum-sensing transcriptional regulator LasR